MGILMSCLFTPPKEVIDPVINENKVVIITEADETEEVATLKSLLVKHDLNQDEILVHVIADNCHKGRMKAHLEEMTGGEELPFVTHNGTNLGAYSQIIAMADTGDLYKAIHGKDRKAEEPKQNVKAERRPSLMDKFFGGDDKPKKKGRRKTNTSSTGPDAKEVVQTVIEEAPPPEGAPPAPPSQPAPPGPPAP